MFHLKKIILTVNLSVRIILDILFHPMRCLLFNSLIQKGSGFA